MKSLFSMVAAALWLSLPSVAQTPEGNAIKGKDLFLNDACYQCHGREGQGGAAGARLAPDPIPLMAIIAYVRHPAGQMPPVSPKVVSNADLADIYAFLKTIPEPKPVKDIALLNPAGSSDGAKSNRSETAVNLPEAKVKEIVAEKCVSCHKLETVTGARHNREEWQKVIASMQDKGSTLTPDEIPSVLDYLSQHFGATGAQATSKNATSPKSQR